MTAQKKQSSTEEHGNGDKNASVADSVLDNIATKKLMMIPRWHFVAKERVLWILGIALVICGALSVSLIIFALANESWVLRRIVAQNTWSTWLPLLPLIWSVLFVIFFISTQYVIAHTKRAYRFTALQMSIGLLVFSSIVGIVLYFVGIAQWADHAAERVPLRLSVSAERGALFEKPMQGMIFGKFKRQSGNFIVITQPRKNKKWRIDTSKISQNIVDNVSVGTRVVIFGKRIDANNFTACDLHIVKRNDRHRKANRRPLKISSKCGSVMDTSVYERYVQRMR